jgi:EmrB/QacA subfamily drug resistance transporter
VTVGQDDRNLAGVAAPAGHDQPVRRVAAFSIIALALLMMSIDSTIVSTALHTMQQDLKTSINWVGWTITAYAFGFMLMLPLSGRLCDWYGRRRVFLGSVFVFTAVSLFCGLASNIYVLIALRALQAAGGAGFTPSATGIIVDHFGSARDRAVSLFGSIFPVGSMIGPIFGGLFVTYWTWRGVFLVNVPIGAAVIVLALRYIPPDRPRSQHPRAGLDASGMALLGVGILAGMFAATYLGEKGAHASSPLFAVPLAVALGTVAAFVRHVHRADQPFISPRLIHGPGFGAVNVINVIFGGVTQGIVALIPLYAANRYGIDALDSGTLLIAEGIAAVALSTVMAMALRRTGYRLPLYVGCVIIVAGVALLAAHPPGGISPYLWLAGSAFLVGTGFGTINPACRNAGLQLAPEHSATVAALRSMVMQFGSITTISIATALLASTGSPGVMQARFDVVAAGLLLVMLPLTARIPEHRGSW